MKKTLIMLVATVVILSGCAGQTATLQKNEVEKPVSAVAEAVANPPLENTKNQQSAQFIAYSKERYQAAMGTKPFALFFHAPWCPDCIKLEKNINATLSSFPSGSLIFKADYDSETALKKEYKILMQSTVVLVGRDGKVADTLSNPSATEVKNALSQLL